MNEITEFTDLYDQCAGWRHHLSIAYRTYLDIDAEIRVSMWEHFSNGVTDEATLFAKVRVDVRRYVRSETRFGDVRSKLRSQARSTQDASNDPIDDLVNVVGSRQLLDLVEIPSGARQWVAHRMGETEQLTPSQGVYGRRWAQRTRKVLAHA